MNEPYTGDGPARKFRDTILFTPVKRGEGGGGLGDSGGDGRKPNGALLVLGVALALVIVVAVLALLV